MSNRLIIENILVAFETMHCINTKRSGRVGEMVLKLDMSKAFDRVEWGFLEKIMYKMGFYDSWVKLMMGCVNTVTYSIIINGRPWGHITLSKGLRQGGPLSPFLFLFCVEGLSTLIRKSLEIGLLSGVAACLRGPKISHLFFSDDSLIFCKATVEECTTLEEILEIYECSSGQQLNQEKTSLFFRQSTPHEIKEGIESRFGADTIRQHETYLGLPFLVGKNRCNTFWALKEKLSNKLSSLKEKLLSHAIRKCSYRRWLKQFQST